ncbi:hypothetical protein HUS23_09065 [Ectothiorhodospiraceae bacterium 2226]|nr:hypothetical protein HUS23_09065 [Ectothiorhodospiraceae bacterium 2226]
MTTAPLVDDGDRPPRRIRLTLDGAAGARAALQTAVTLARQFQADLEAMLVQHVALGRAAGLPFAAEVSLFAGAERRLNAPTMQRQLHAVAAEVHVLLAELAAPARINWSLHTLTRSRWETVLTEPDEPGVLVVGHQERHRLVVRTPVESAERVVVVDADGPRGRLARRVALALDPNPMMVPTTVDNLMPQIAALRPRVLILPAGAAAERLAALRPLLARLDCTVLLVG